ncbi:hypothetical protein LCGC14_0175360 [marine sediment metagenome]|uniref:Uncharacterized protein n=1 Tax=marine sediment metagenome TaxID=412755 RepID=A0A0F9V7G8_9ZZZZ
MIYYAVIDNKPIFRKTITIFSDKHTINTSKEVKELSNYSRLMTYLYCQIDKIKDNNQSKWVIIDKTGVVKKYNSLIRLVNIE